MKSNAQKVLIFTATYNEAEEIENFYSRVKSTVASADILVIDDSSPDGTGAILDRLATRDPQLHIIHRHSKLGLGSAHKVAFEYAMNHGYGVLVTMDADLSHLPEQIPALLSALDQHDFIIGSRYMKGGSCNYTGYRKGVSICANYLCKTLLGIPLDEFTTSFRAFRVEKLRIVDLQSITSSGYAFFLETTVRIHRHGLRTDQVPISFQNRQSGVSKISGFEILLGMKMLLSLLFSSNSSGRAGKSIKASTE